MFAQGKGRYLKVFFSVFLAGLRRETVLHTAFGRKEKP